MVDNFIDEVDFDLSKPECLDELKQKVIEHSHYFEFTDVQRKYVRLCLIEGIDYDKIEQLMGLGKNEFRSIRNGTWHRLRGRRGKTYKYKIYPINNPDEYLLFPTINSVSKVLKISLSDVRSIIKNQTIYNNIKIVKYEN